MGGGGDGRFAEVWSDRQRGREGERSGRQGVTTAPVLLDQLPVVVYAAALDEANTTLYLSPWSETILGLRPEEWVGLPHLLPDLVHPGDYQRVAAELRAAQARCEPFRCEYRVVRRDGRLVWVRDEASIARQPDGQPLFLQGVMVDVTDGKQAEQDLQESEQRYRRLVEMSPDAIAVHCDGRFVYINPAGMRLLGASRPEEVVGKSIYEIVHPDYHAVVEERVRQQLHELRPAPLIHERYRRLDGTVVDVEVASTPVVYRGRPAIQVVARDITHRKRVEERLHEHARQQAAVASLGRQALAGLDLNRLMDEAVRRVVETLGVPFGCVFELRRSENVLLVRAGVGWGDDVVGRAVVGVGRGSHAGYTLLCQAPVVVEDWRSERRFHVPWLVRAHGVVSGVCVVIHGRDHPFGVLAVGTRERRRFREEEVHFLQAVANLLGEAVERARAEQALREREERFRLLAENAQDMVFRYELKPKRGYSYVNPAATRITGYTPEEYYADPFILCKYVHERHREDALALLQDGVVKQWDTWQFYHRDGSLRWAEVCRVPVYDERGDLVAFEGIIRDITERKRLEERLLRAQRLEVAGQIAAQIAHDFNNLLQPLVGYPTLIKRLLPKHHRLASCCDAMLDAARQMVEINRDLMTLGRRGSIDDEPVQLNDVVEDAIAELGPLPHTLVLRVDLARDLRPIRGSATQLVRVVTNLLVNAREAMQDVGVLRVATENAPPPVPHGEDGGAPAREYVRLTVADSGPGIPPEVRERIFDAFFTTKKTGRRRGSGLGLTIVQSIVADHQGFVDVQSEVGRGATFRIYLPASATDGVDPRVEHPRGGTERVLVVADDEEQRELVRQLLATIGYRAETAATVADAVAALERRPVDLVLLDAGPGIGGVDAYRQIVRARPGQRTIVMMDQLDSEQLRRLRAVGAVAHVRKPATLEMLARAIRAELDRRDGAPSVGPDAGASTC